jgi:hypothetical protein
MYDIDVYKLKTNEQINKEEELVELRRQCNELIKSNKKLAMMLIKKNFKK